MALTTASLKAKIIAEISAALGAPADGAQLAKFAEAIAKAVVDEIQANAVVTVAGNPPGTVS